MKLERVGLGDFFKYIVGKHTTPGLHPKNRSSLFSSPTCIDLENRYLRFLADHQNMGVESRCDDTQIFDGKQMYDGYTVQKSYSYGEESSLITTGQYSGWIAYPSKRHNYMLHTRRPLYPYPTIQNDLLRSTFFDNTRNTISLVSNQDIRDNYIQILTRLLLSIGIPVDEDRFIENTQHFYDWARWSYVVNEMCMNDITRLSSK